jgi:SsrA-binding protein
LLGTEVKSVRAGRVNLLDSYAAFTDGQLFANHIHIGAYERGSHFNHDPYRRRRLLLHRAEMRRLSREVDQKRLTLVPLRMYLSKQWVKLELGLARGRRSHDKRQRIAERESKRRIAQVMAESRRR